METATIGRTDVSVSKLGLGCGSFAGYISPVPAAEAIATVTRAAELGVTYFDTSPFYGHGRSEHLVGDALRFRQGWTLSTKVGRRLASVRRLGPASPHWLEPFPFHPVFDYSYDGTMRSFEDSLQRLATDKIDVLLIHDIDSVIHGDDQPMRFREAMDGAQRALVDLKRSGDVGAIGIGVNETAVCLSALAHGDWDCFLLAGRYTLLEQGAADELLPAMQRKGTSMIVGGPFNSGILVGRENFNYSKAPAAIVARVKVLQDVCAAHGIPLAAAALHFAAAHPVIASVIPGASSPNEVEQISSWWRTPIPGGLWSDLAAAGLIQNTP
jgi:D-threo-aldose 1-dehydrogenase